MSDKIEERVVGLKFDQGDFEKRIKTTIDSLAALDKALKLNGATKGLEGLADVARNVSLDHIDKGVDSLVDKFRVLSIVGITALANIANRAVSAGISIARSLTIDPIRTGLAEYETNLNSIQTIMANTQAAGTTLQQVNDALAELNLYADLTIYNFAEMARNIGTFTAAGVALEPSVAAIKGIANLAALSGSNSQQAATAMYQLSQALSTGTVKLIDWNSVVNAGMGGTVFQRALAQTAVVMGTLNEEAVTLSGNMKTVKIFGNSFRDSLQEGWLTADVLTATLAQFTGDLTDAELAAMGFNETQIREIQKQAETAKAAATEVKTITQLMGALRESAGSGWANTWQIIFGDFEEAKKLWSGVYKVMDGIIGEANDARNELLRGWKELGGRDELIQGVTNAFVALAAILRPIGEAFRQIFPKKTAEDLYRITVAFKEFTAGLKISDDTADKLRRTFAGIFAVFGIGVDIAKQIFGVLLDLFGVVTDNAGGFLDVTANIGDFLVNLRESIREGNGLVRFFETVGNVLAVPIKLLGAFGDILARIFGNFTASGAADAVTDFVGNVEPLGKLSEFITYAWDKVVGVFQDAWSVIGPIGDRLSNFFSSLGRAISSVFGGVEFQDILNAFNTGIFASLVLVIRNSMGRGGLGGVFHGLTETLETMQNTLRAATLLQIALAIGVLTLSVSALSDIDPVKLATALGAIAVMFTQLYISLAVLEAMPPTHTARIFAAALAMSAMGVAIRILSGAVLKLSTLNYGGLIKGLAGVVVLLTSVTKAVSSMPPTPGIVATSIAMIFLGTALKIIASAAEDLSELNWGELARGVIGVGGVLAALAGFTKFAGPGGVLQGAGIVLLALGIKILASAMHDISDISWENIGKGIATLAVALAAIYGALKLIPPSAPLAGAGVLILALSLGMIADGVNKMGQLDIATIGKGILTLAAALAAIYGALKLIPPSSLLSAAGVLVVAASLGLIADAFAQMGGNDWDVIGRGMTVLGGSLAIIAGAMKVMKTALPGAGALLLIATSLAILAPVLSTFGKMSWDEIGRGLATMAGFFGVLGVTALVLAPLVPVILALGGAVALLGAGFALAGVGVLALATGITALSVAGTAGTLAMVSFFSALIGLIPFLAEQLGVAIVTLIRVIGAAGPDIFEAATALLVTFADAIIKSSPKLAEAAIALIISFCDIIDEASPKLIETGFNLLLNFLRGIRDNIGHLTNAGIDIVLEFLAALGSRMGDLASAGFRFVIEVLNGLSDAIDKHSEDLGRAGGRMAAAVIKGFIAGAKGAWSGFWNELIWGDAEMQPIAPDAPVWEGTPTQPSNNDAMMGLMRGVRNDFQALGNESAVAFADGLEKGSRRSVEGVKKMGDKVTLALGNIVDVLKNQMDLNPTITPVLDITDVKAEAAKLEGILGAIPRMADSSYSSALGALVGFQSNIEDALESIARTVGNTINFTQNNYSPKALSAGEIYRQTNNQLSTAKGVYAA